MPRGWTKDNELNSRIYELWKGMLRRCYSKEFLKKRPTYSNCYVCERWLKLSNFVNDISKINNYEHWIKNKNYQLDKDIKSNGINKCYCLEECQFISQEENTKQAVKTRNNNYLMKENNPMKKIPRNEIKNIFPCIAINKKTKEIYEENSIILLCEKLQKITGENFDSSAVAKVCKYNHNKDEYINNHKVIVKSVKGFDFYYKDDWRDMYEK